jgi:hypothetical protein
LIAVELAASLTDEHKTLVLRYLGAAERFSLAEWVTLLEAFTMLSDSTVQLQGTTLTLQAFYDRFIDQVYGDACIAELLAAIEISASAPVIQARYARQLYQQLRREPFMLGDTPATESLLGRNRSACWCLCTVSSGGSVGSGCASSPIVSIPDENRRLKRPRLARRVAQR